jgi:hypothetical protein
MQTGRDKQKVIISKVFAYLYGHDPSDKELFECEQTFYFLGRAIYRYQQLQEEQNASSK